jgi:hypothetical protein
MAERRQGLIALAATLPRVARQVLRRRGFAEGGLALDWALIVGADLARSTLPLKVAYAPGERRRGVLHLKVASGFAPAVAHAEPQIVERVNAYLGYGAVERLRLTQGPLPSRPPVQPQPPGPDSNAAPAPLPDIGDCELAAALTSFAAALRRGRRDP